MKVVTVSAMNRKKEEEEEESFKETKPFRMKIISKFKVSLVMVYQIMKCQWNLILCAKITWLSMTMINNRSKVLKRQKWRIRN